jgi:hypothetical protein
VYCCYRDIVPVEQIFTFLGENSSSLSWISIRKIGIGRESIDNQRLDLSSLVFSQLTSLRGPSSQTITLVEPVHSEGLPENSVHERAYGIDHAHN